MKLGRRTWLRWFRQEGEDYVAWHWTLTRNKKRAAR